MRDFILTIATLWCLLMTSCGDYNKVDKTPDYTYKYEAAKQYFSQGYYNRSAQTLQQVISVFKGTETGEESLFLLGMANLNARNYDAAATYLRRYYQSYPKGLYTEAARYYTGMALYLSTPEPKLDQSATYEAVTEFQNFIETFPTSIFRSQAQDRIFELQNKLVEKEYLSAKLYYDLGGYFLNGGNGNYQACIVTSENAIKDFPYAKRREDFAYLILKAKYEYAKHSVFEKQAERYSDAIDEYYGFHSEFPESKYMKEAKEMINKIPKAFYKPEMNDSIK